MQDYHSLAMRHIVIYTNTKHRGMLLLQVWPIIAFPVQEINKNSVQLVEKHRMQWPNERLLQQVRTLPSI